MNTLILKAIGAREVDITEVRDVWVYAGNTGKPNELYIMMDNGIRYVEIYTVIADLKKDHKVLRKAIRSKNSYQSCYKF